MLLFLAVAIALTVSCAFYPALGLPGGLRLVVLVALELVVLLTPLVVGPGRLFGRFLACVLAIALAVKLFDLHLGAELGHRPRFRDVFTFLINLSSVVQRKLADEPRPGFRVRTLPLAATTLAAVPGGLLFAAYFLVDWRPVPFAVEHSAKVLAFFLLLVPAGAAGAAIWRLLGGSAREPMDNPFAADHDRATSGGVLQPAGRAVLPRGCLQALRRDAPVRSRGPWRPSPVSGLVHEYLFVITLLQDPGLPGGLSSRTQGIGVVLDGEAPSRGMVESRSGSRRPSGLQGANLATWTSTSRASTRWCRSISVRETARTDVCRGIGCESSTSVENWIPC